MKKKLPKQATPPPKAYLFPGLKTQGPKDRKADEIELIPFDEFKTVIKKTLSTTKAESDKQLAEFQASNLKKREAKKRG